MVMEGEEVTEDDATRERVTMPARTSSASTASWPASTTPHNSTSPFMTSNNLSRSFSPTVELPPYSGGRTCYRPHDFYQYPTAPHSHWSIPSLPKQRCWSLPPTFRRLEDQLLRIQPSPPMLAKALSTHQPTPSQSPSFTNPTLNSHQRQRDTEDERSTTPPSRAASTLECEGFESSITPHTPCLPSRIDQPSPNMQDEQVWPKVQLLPDVEDKRRLSTTIHTFAADVACSLISNHTSEMRQPRNSEDDAKVRGTNEQPLGERDVAAEGDEVIEVPCTHSHPIQLTSTQGIFTGGLITVPARTLSSSAASQPTSTAPTSTATYIPNSTPCLHRGASKPFPRSFTNIDDQLYTLFLNHPKSHVNDYGEPAIPTNALVDIFCSLSHVSNTPLLSEDEITILKSLLADKAGLLVTPQVLMQFVAEETRASPPGNPISNDCMQLLPLGGRGEVMDGYIRYCRYSSGESTGTSCHSSSTSSRGPHTPNEGQGEDKDGYGRYYLSLSNETNGTSYEHGYSSPDDNNHTIGASRSNPGDAFFDSISSIPVARADRNGNDLDSDQDLMLGLEMDCSMTSSMVSLEPLEGLDALQRVNAGLDRKWMAAEHKRLPSKELALPITFDNATDTSSPMHNSCSTSPLVKSHNLFLHPHHSTPISPKRWCSSLSLPSHQLEPSPSIHDEHIPTEVLPLPGAPTVDNKQNPSSMTLYRRSPAFIASSRKLEKNDEHGYLPDDDNFSALAKVSQVTTSASNIHTTGELQPKATTIALTQYPISIVMERDKEPDMSCCLGMESRFENSPMAKLLREYRSQGLDSQRLSIESQIQSIIDVDELGPEMIMDRGSNRAPRLPRYHLVKAMMNNLTVVVTAQQNFLQQAAALIVDRKSYFKVDPGDTLIPILQGTSSLPQLYTVWRALTTRNKLGVKAWEKYIAEYQLQVGAAALSSLSALHC